AGGGAGPVPDDRGQPGAAARADVEQCGDRRAPDRCADLRWRPPDLRGVARYGAAHAGQQPEAQFDRPAAGDGQTMTGRWVGLVAALVLAGSARAQRMELTWPTPNRAWADGRPIAEFLQHAGSGDPESGGFGGVRSGGTQFHEGIDIKCLTRDRRGEPTDVVSAALPGIVRLISTSAGDSSYGRYIVLEHPGVSPAIYTLYAHLARIAPGLHVG